MNRNHAILAAGCLLVALTLAAYWPVNGHKFISLDDPRYIYDNPQVKAGLTWPGAVWAFRTGYAGNWHPLTWLSHMADCQLYGLNPAGHHLTNLLFHVTNALLLFLLLHRMTGSLWRSTFVAALFAWHPLRVESVAWAAERKDVLSTFFFLLTLWAYVRYANTECRRGESTADASPAGYGPHTTVHKSHFTFHISPFYLLSLVFFACGLMSKAMIVTLPCVLLLLDFWPLRRIQVLSPFAIRHSPFVVGEKLPFFALALAASIVTYLVQQSAGAVSSLEHLPIRLRVANAVVAYVRYLFLTLWPRDLCVIYPYTWHVPLAWVIAAALLLAGLSGMCLLRVRHQPYLIVGWLWFLGTLVPTIGLVQVGSQSLADRYTYIPSIGLFLLVVWGLDEVSNRLPWKRLFLPTAGTLAVAACLVCTRHQLNSWQDSESLYRRAISASNENYIAYDGLGSALEAGGDLVGAIQWYSEAVRLNPHYSDGQYDLGTALMREGELDDAVPHLTAAIAASPAFAHAHINLGKAFLDEGELDQAGLQFRVAVRLTSNDPEAHYNLGTVLLMRANVDQAVACFSEALRLKPNYGEAHGNLGIALMRQGKPEQGAAHLAVAAKLSPADPEALINLGLAYLKLNHLQDAADQFSESLRLDPESPSSHYHLALALTRQDKPQEALPHARKARDLAQAAGQSALAAKAQTLMDRYQ